MNKILIKEVSRPGVDAKVFRAYRDDGNVPSAQTTLKVTASSTSQAALGALRCAAKAFAKYSEPGGDMDEIETRVKVTRDKDIDGLWLAELEPGRPAGISAGTTRVGVWKSVKYEMPDSEQSVLIHAPDEDEPVWLGYHDGESWRWIDARQLETKVTHWMSIPEPPEVPS